MPLTPGSTFERYTIEALVGRGGMGEVYRAIDTRLHRPVALKVLRTDKDAAAAVSEAGGVARLLREARAAAALNHANSVAIYELGEFEGTSYIAMELVTGSPLRRYVGDTSVSIDTKVSWLVDAARALWAAHKSGLVHRDVKPGNIMVSEEGVVKVLDFGLAKPVHVSPDPAAFQTQMGQLLGTPRYMAPEQIEGHPADASADQFSFGVTAYELLSGVFPGGAMASNVPSLDAVSAGASPELAKVVARMMNRHPRDRYATMEEAAHALRSCAPSLRIRTSAAPGPGPGAGSAAHARPGRAGRTSDAPTAVGRPTPPASVDANAKGSTLPLNAPQARAEMNRTLPLAAPTPAPFSPAQAQAQAYAQATPQPISGTQSPTSGVYTAGSRAAAPRRSDDPSPDAPPASRPAEPRMWPLVVVFIVFAIGTGGVAAWFLR